MKTTKIEATLFGGPFSLQSTNKPIRDNAMYSIIAYFTSMHDNQHWFCGKKLI